ncbi:MAG: sigma-70 family RNA polymerase sigma factor [Ilumatobacteraceae bacterium]
MRSTTSVTIERAADVVAQGSGVTSAAARERDLLRAVAGGDRVAFAALYDITVGSAFGVAVRVVRDRQLAEDVTQEAFIEVWTHAARFDAERGNVRSWIVMLAHRRAVDRVRNEQSRGQRQQAAGAVPAPAPTIPDDDVVDADERVRVGAAMQALTAVQRQALELAFFEGLTHVEIAGRLDVPLGTVKTRINGGYRGLRTALTTAP